MDCLAASQAILKVSCLNIGSLLLFKVFVLFVGTWSNFESDNKISNAALAPPDEITGLNELEINARYARNSFGVFPNTTGS